MKEKLGVFSALRRSAVNFTLKNWNLAVQAYPERPEELPTETTGTAKAGK